jgi:hypothetical protein
MGSRQYVAQIAIGCSTKGKTIAKTIFGDGLFCYVSHRSFRGLNPERARNKTG